MSDATQHRPDEDLFFQLLRARARNGDELVEGACVEIARLRAALDRIAKHPQTPYWVARIACEALEGKEG